VDLLLDLRGVSYAEFYNPTNNERFRSLLLQSIQSIAQISSIRIRDIYNNQNGYAFHHVLRAPMNVTTLGAVQLILKPSDANVVSRLLSTVFLYEQVRQVFPPNGSVVSVEVRRVASSDPSQISGNSGGSSAPIGAIVGGAVAGAAALILAIVAVLLWRRRRRRQTASTASTAAIGGAVAGPLPSRNDTIDVGALKPDANGAALGAAAESSFVTMPLVVGPNATLRELARERLLYGMLAGTARAAQTGSEAADGTEEYQPRAPGILVADDRGVQVLSAACRMSDLIGNGVFLVEELSPQPPTFEALPQGNQGRRAIYFFKPTSSTVDTLITALSKSTKASEGTDAEADPAAATGSASIEVYATSRVEEKYLDRVRTAPHLVERLAQFTELNIDFCAFEQRIFHLGRYPAEMAQTKTQTIAESLLTLCSVLRERPRIRYARDSWSGAPAAVAGELARILDEYGPLILPAAGTVSQRRPTSRTVLLLVDRDCDLITPLLHDDTYQMVLRQEFPDLLEPESRHEPAMVLDEYADDVWSLIRYRALADVVRLRIAKRGALGANVADANTLLPPEVEPKSLQRHQRLAQRAQSLWASAQLGTIAALEREMLYAQRVVGTDAESRVREQLRQLLQEDGIRTLDKIRLIVLFALTQNTSSAEIHEFATMMASRSSFTESRSAGSSLSTSISSAASKSTSVGSAAISADARLIQQVMNVVETLCCRYGVPLHKTAAEMQSSQQSGGRLAKLATLLVERRLGESAFPYFGEGRRPDREYLSEDSSAGEYSEFSTDDEESGIRRRSRSLRRRRSSSALRESSLSRRRRSSSSSIGSVDDAPTRRVIIFVIGGLAWNETRIAYELSASSGTQVFLGGTSMLDARNFLESLLQSETENISGVISRDAGRPEVLPPTPKLVRSSSAAALNVLSQRKRSRSRSASRTRP
jgi:syntaxin-binding protein 1